MTVVETVLIFVGIPAGVLALFAILILAPSAVRAPRYRPGSAWNYQPVWYLPHPEHAEPVSALADAHGDTRALAAGNKLAIAGGTVVTEPATPTGGASGEW